MFWNRISSSYFWKVRLWYKIRKSCINLAGGIRLRFSSVFQAMRSWASAHRGKWGQLTPLENGWKIKKRKHAKRAVFHVYVLFWEQSGQAGVDNGAMPTTYLFRYILHNPPFRSQFFTIFFASGGKVALTPLTKILRTFLDALRVTVTSCRC